MPAGLRMGLRERLIVILLLAVIGSGLIGGLISSMRIRGSITNELNRRTEIINHALDASLDVASAVKGGDHASADAFVSKLLSADEELVYIVVMVGDQQSPKPVAWAHRGMLEQSAEPRPFVVAGHDLNTAEGRAGLVRDFYAETSIDTSSVIHRAVNIRSAAGHGEEGAGGLEELALQPVALIGMTPDVQIDRFRSVTFTASALSGLTIIVILWVFFSRLSERVNRLKSHAARIASGDLTEVVNDSSTDEFGELSRALDAIARGLGQTISQVRAASLETDSISGRVRDASRQIASDAGTQATSVRQTSAAMSAMSRASEQVEAQIGEVTRSAEVSADRLRDISGAIERVSSTVHQVSAAVDQTRQHLEDNVGSLGEVDKAVDRLNNAAEGTAAATNQITASISSVERSTEEALQMSRETSRKAESGVHAVKETLDGIQRIRQFTNETVESIRFLSQKVASIERILDVIDDIANQTKLLSLNASIIAAQAGEHGRGFLVVAEEIKALASKTAGSTREISSVIGEVLKVSENVISVAERGVRTVDDGVVRSEHADAVLSGILDASTRTGALVRTIAAAMAEQARSALQVNQAMQDVHSIAVRVRGIVSSQKAESSQLENSMRQMKAIMDRSLSTAKEQAVQVSQAIEAIGTIFRQIHSVSSSNQEQVRSRAEVAKAFEVLEGLSQRHRESARQLSAAVEQAAAQSMALTSAVKVFRV